MTFQPTGIAAPEHYRSFLEHKIKFAPVSGAEIGDDDINPILKPHQRAIVKWAVNGGQRAIFAAFGLGKSVIQIEILRIISERFGGLALIIAPLGVRQELARDAAMLGVEAKFIRSVEDAIGADIYITNYETVRDGKIDPNAFTALSLDEASVLRSFGSKTYQTFLSLFERVRFKFVATATPSPNRYKEIIHYAGFLGVMDTGQALTRWFQRDSQKAGNLTLYPHKEDEFWLWVSSWAVFVQSPADLGFDATGYDLPPLNVHYHEVQVDLSDGGWERDGQGVLIRDDAMSLSASAREKRETLPARIEAMKGILAESPADHCIIWHDLEAERHAIDKAVPGVVSVYGSQDLDEREQAIIDFSDGKFQFLSAKPVIAGSGCNFQRHCHKAIFLGIGWKFNDFIQAIHRIQRFLQPHAVEIHVIYAESERKILKDLLAKWSRHNEMVQKMSEIIKKYGLNKDAMLDTLTRTIGIRRVEAKGERFLAANNDCVEECRLMDDNSVDLVVTSIPFSNHYEYSPSYNDFGHTDDNEHFWAQMDFLTPELLRVLKPGRLACIHVKDRILFGNVTGAGIPTSSPFHAETIMHYRKHGFDYVGMITVNTDVVAENNGNYRLSYTEMCKDGTKMGVGSPEYIVLVHKPQTDRTKGYADERVSKSKDEYSLSRWQIDAHAFWRSSGNRLATAEDVARLGPSKLAKAFTEESLKYIYDHEFHVEIGEALAVAGRLPTTFMALAPGSHDPNIWHDVVRMRTLNGEQAARNVEKHICPLQFDIVDRLIRRYSNPDDLVFDPFGGLMTVPVRAIKLGRRGRGVELNPAYYLDGVRYCEKAEKEASAPDLFALLSADMEAA